jgi:hypothetical protein
VIHVKGGFEVVINRGKIVEAVANGHDSGNLGGPSLLNYHKLFYRVINNKPHMGVSIKILHGFFQIKGRINFFPNWIIPIITRKPRLVKHKSRFLF